ncbi:MAG: ABC transporter permease [Gracilibacteraceae bacterium]|nr:ABC transporter permease [Gracilibacteraceae bacterium]
MWRSRLFTVNRSNRRRCSKKRSTSRCSSCRRSWSKTGCGGRPSTIGLVADDTVLSAAANLRQSVAEVIAAENAGAIVPRLVGMGLNSAQAGALPNTFSLRQRTPFNPAMSYLNFMVVGFGHVALLALCLTQTAGVIPRLRLRERWPDDRRCPLGLFSRLLPYMLIFAAATLLVLGLTKRFLALRFAGGVLDYALPLLLYLLALSLLGMILGCLSKTPSQVLSRAIPVIAPSFFLSNLTLPLSIMPAPLQALSQALPLSWYVRFYQGVAIRGASLADLSADLGGFLIYIAALGLLLLPLLIREARSRLI